MKEKLLLRFLPTLTIWVFVFACSSKESKKIQTTNDEGSEYESREFKFQNRDHFVLIENIETFKKQFNSFTNEITSSLQIHEVKINEGTSNDQGKAFEYSFSNNFHVIGGLNEDNSISSLAVLLESNISSDDAANFLAAAIGVIASTNPTLTPEDRGNILKEVGIINMQNTSGGHDKKLKTVRNGVEYTFGIIPGLGVSFNADNPNN